MAKEPLVTRSKAGQVKGLIESEFADTLETAKTLLCISGQFCKIPLLHVALERALI